MSANKNIRVSIPEPSISVMHSRRGDLRAMTARDVIAFARDLQQAIGAGLDPDAKVEWFRSGDGAYGHIYGGKAASKIQRSEGVTS